MLQTNQRGIPEFFGDMVFNDHVMKERLPKDTYKALKKTISDGKSLDKNIASVLASVLKDWAIEKGATHYTHWFQPMTGITAEKHDSFIAPDGNGKVIMEFSGKELIRGEPDASSFPSGGLRATFEARGYTAWDPTSYAFIKDATLCIPTVFCSYSGESLDKKTPLLRSMERVNKQALRILRLFGNTEVTHVESTVGAEQEYFLIDSEMRAKRPDLVFCGRTLFGAKPVKGQEMDDHYFGMIKPRVRAFMKDLNHELWSLGVLAKTEHNEAAPAQHELAPVFSNSNLATDQNQLTMETMRKVAVRHNLSCLLHEKPFDGVNGSGKHNNWSLSTNTGANLFEPGDTPSENAQFLLFLCAVLKAVDDYQDLLRVSVACASNDNRLGGGEAPPSIISIFLGEELSEILSCIETDTPYCQKDKQILKVGVHTLPRFPKDTTDRNRTSPFAFTGNKFEFRMLGSSMSVADPNIILNTIIADVLCQFADELEKESDFNTALHAVIKRTITAHKRIIFNGNSYSKEWEEEAKTRGLSNFRTTADALPAFITQKSIDLFTRHNIYTEQEIHSRYDIMLDNYCKTLNIEALTMIQMMKRDISPAIRKFMNRLSQTIMYKNEAIAGIDCEPEKDLLQSVSMLNHQILDACKALEAAHSNAESTDDLYNKAMQYKDNVLSQMKALREKVDAMEEITDRDIWPYPSYGDLLHSVY